MQDFYQLLAVSPRDARRLNFRVYEITSRGDRRRFARFPWQLYRRDARWVPPLLDERLAALKPERNPALTGPELALFLAEAANLGLGDEPIGTIAVWIDPDRDAAWFGALEAINEPDIIAALLEAAEIWATQHLPGAAALRGPASLDVRGLPGLLVDGFDRWPAAHLPYNAPYLPELVEAAGYTPAPEEWQTCELPLSATNRKRPAESPAGVTIRPADAGDWPAERARLADIYGAAGIDTGAGPDEALTPGAAILEEAPGWRLEPRLALFAEADGQPVGAIAALPDLSPVLRAANGRWFPTGWLAARLAGRRMRRLRVLPSAVLPAWRGRRIEALLCQEVARSGARLGFLQAVYGPLPAAGDDVTAALEALGAEKAQGFRLSEKTLGSEGW